MKEPARELRFGRLSRKKFCVITRYLRDEYDASNGHGRIGVALKGGIPEILRVALGAGKEPDALRTWIQCKSQREGRGAKQIGHASFDET